MLDYQSSDATLTVPSPFNNLHAAHHVKVMQRSSVNPVCNSSTHLSPTPTHTNSNRCDVFLHLRPLRAAQAGTPAQ